MVIHFHIGRAPVVIAIGESPVAPILRELQEKDEVLLLTGARYPVEGELARYIMRRCARRRPWENPIAPVLRQVRRRP